MIIFSYLTCVRIKYFMVVPINRSEVHVVKFYKHMMIFIWVGNIN
jgi:hypothetical protein